MIPPEVKAMKLSFPQEYSKPVLLDVFDAAAAGWSAKCQGGSAPDQTQIICSRGSSAHLNGAGQDGFLTPDQLQQGL
jgi:hypothetical protein